MESAKIHPTEASTTDKINAQLDNRMVSAEEDAEKHNDLEVLRLRVKKFMTASWTGKTYSQIMLILSVISCLEFIYQTYLTPRLAFQRRQTYYLSIIELAMSGLFAFDWVLAFFIADHKIMFMSSFYSMVDLLTVIPIWATFFTDIESKYQGIDSLEKAIFYALEALNTTRILRALRMRKYLLLVEDPVDRCLGDMALVITMMILFSEYSVFCLVELFC